MRYTGRWPFKKRFTVIMGGLLVVYLYAIYSILMHTWQKNIFTTSTAYTQQPEIIWLMLAVVAGGWVKWKLKQP